MSLTLAPSSDGTVVAGDTPATGSGNAAVVDPPGLNIDDCESLLADVGFLLVPGAPTQGGPAYLLVALRRQPTRAHFDPERIELWVRADGRSEPAQVSWTERPESSCFRWGTIRLIDRVPVVNRFVAFGGRLETERRGGTRIVILSSDAPILSLNEHIGPADPLAASVGGFFATLRAAVAVSPSVERCLESTAPTGIYAAYLQFALRRASSGLAADATPAELVTLLRSERDRLACSPEVDAQSGQRLAREIDDFRRSSRP